MDNRDDTPQIPKLTRKTRVTRKRKEIGVESGDESAPVDERALFSPVLNETDSWDTVGGSDQAASLDINGTKVVQLSVMQSLREADREDEPTHIVTTTPPLRRSHRHTKNREDATITNQTNDHYKDVKTLISDVCNNIPKPPREKGSSSANLFETEESDDDLQYDEKEIMRETPNAPPSTRVIELMNQNLLSLGISPPVEPSPRNTPVDRPESRALNFGEPLIVESPKVVIADRDASPVYLLVESGQVNLSGLERNCNEQALLDIESRDRNVNGGSSKVDDVNTEQNRESETINSHDKFSNCIDNEGAEQKCEQSIVAEERRDPTGGDVNSGKVVRDGENVSASKYQSLLEINHTNAGNQTEIIEQNVPSNNLVLDIQKRESLRSINQGSNDDRMSQIPDGSEQTNSARISQNEDEDNLETGLASDFNDEDSDKENAPIASVLPDGTMVDATRLVPYIESDDESEVTSDEVQTPMDARLRAHPKSPPKLPVRRLVAPLREIEIELPTEEVVGQNPMQADQLDYNNQGNEEIGASNAEQQSEIFPVMHSTAFDNDSLYLGEMIEEPPMTDQERMVARVTLRRRLFSASSGQSSQGIVHKSRPKKGKRAGVTPKIVATGKNKAVVSTSNRVHISKRENHKTKAQLQKEREQEKRLMIIKRQAANVATDRFNDSPLQYFLETDQMQCFGVGPSVVVVSKAEQSSYPQSNVQYANKPPECPIAVIAKEVMAMQVTDCSSRIDHQNAMKKCQQRCLNKLNVNKLQNSPRGEISSESEPE